MRIIFDTYAWIEYFRGTSKGKVVEKFLKSHEILTPVLVLAELSCKAAREKWSFGKLLEFIKARSLILSIDEKIVTRTGHLYTKVRAQIKNFGLIDSIILATSQIEKADVLTGDPHFKSFENVRFL